METKNTYNLQARLAKAREILPEELQHPLVLAVLVNSLAEDLSPDGLEGLAQELYLDDLTSAATLPPNAELAGVIFTREEGVVAGLPMVHAIFKLLLPSVGFIYKLSDGDQVDAGTDLANVSGTGIGLLAGERSALNFLGRMSGIASLTRQFVNAVAGTNATILDTRKTAPGWRMLDKYAVRMGGAQNHRMGLYDMVLIKNNHIDAAGGIRPAVEGVRRAYGHRYPLEVEVRSLIELQVALTMQPTRILLDNMDLESTRQAVKISAGSVPLEASGNVSLDTVRDIAETGVDYISAGSLTHSAPALDVSMHVGGVGV